MKQIYISTLILCFTFNIGNIDAQTIWTGSTLTFSKENNTDWTLEANQDRITNNVWITRANNQGIFNIVTEANYTDFSSPSDTEWAIGTTANIGSLTFQNWEDTSGSNPPSLVNQDMVVHLITDDIYIDIKFTSWQSGGAGGGFTYERSTDQNLNTNEFELSTSIKIYPNPSSEFIKISGLTENQKYSIYNILGSEIKNGLISNNEQIDIRNFTKGLYFLKFKDEITIKFLKE
jgi:hypothetical protein